MAPLPPVLSFENFDVRIEPADNGMVRAVVQSSSAGSPYGTPFGFPSLPTTNEIFSSDDPTLPTSVGSALFDAIFRGQILEAYNRSKQGAESNGKSLRIRLRLHTAPALARVPWELLAPRGQNPLVLSKHTPLVRYLDLLGTPKPLTIKLPLRILVVIAAPPSLPFIKGDEEWEALQRAVAPLQAEGLVKLERLDNGTVGALRRALSSDAPYHVLHYIGHSRFNEVSGEGELLLEPDTPERDEVPLSARTFTQMVGEHRTTQSDDPRSFRLVYLSSCQGTVGEGTRATGSLAQTLVEQGMPAVIAMQGYLPSRDGVALASHFYRAIAEGNPVDAALSIARQTFYIEQQQSLSWALPALFLRSDNSYLFALPGQVLPEMAGATLPPAPGEPPYKGLAYYDLNDHEHFFGRETLTRELVEHLRSSHALVVVGASGSGKSSVVRAGVLAALLGRSTVVESSHLPRRPDTWLYRVLTPTATPLTSLAAALTQDEPSVLAAGQLKTDLEQSVTALDLYLKRRTAGNPESRFLLVIDQLEELLTQCKSPDEQKQFLESLFYALEQQAPLTVILTLRADFYDKFTAFPVLKQAFERQQRVVVAMKDAELRRAIEEPAAQGKWDFEQGLVDLLLTDAGNEPGNLPLLSHALHETWLRRSGRTLTFAGYVASGRIQGAIARTADTLYATLSSDDKTLARKIFVELTELGEGTQDTRRRVAIRDLDALSWSPDDVDALLKTLADARLITLGQETAEVAHEALIREWATLRGWVAEDRAWLQFRRELARDVDEWEKLDRDAGALYRGARLAQVVEEAGRYPIDLRPLEREFLTVSQQREAADANEKVVAEERARRNTLLTRFAWALGLVLLITLGFAGFAYQQRLVAQQEREFAIAAQVTSTIDEGLAKVALATATVAQAEAETARRQILSLRLASESSSLLSEHHQPLLALLTAIESVKRPLDSSETVISEAIEQLHITSDKTGGVPLESSKVAFSPNGEWMAIGSDDNIVRLRETSDLTSPPVILQERENSITKLEFSPDGVWFATGSSNNMIHLWKLADLNAAPITLQGDNSLTNNFVFSPDGVWLAGTFDNTIKLWKLADLNAAPITLQGNEEFSNFITTLAFSPDGTWLAVGNFYDVVRLWKLADLTATPIILQGNIGFMAVILNLEFSPNGMWLATSNGDTSVELWSMVDLTAASTPIVLQGHTGYVTTLEFSPDGVLLATGSADTTVRLWSMVDLTATSTPIVLQGHTSSVTELAFSPNGERLATGSSDNTVRLWKMADTTAPPIILQGHEASIDSLVFSPDGMWLVTSSDNDMTRLWEVSDLTTTDTLLEGHEGPITTLAFSPDGLQLATGSTDTTTRLWKIADPTATPILLQGHTDSVTTLAFSPNGLQLATGSLDMTVRLWRAEDPAASPVVLQGHEGSITTLDFSPNGEWLATGSRDTTVRLWRAADPAASPVVLQGHEGSITTLDFSPNGEWLATGSWDTTVRLWRVADPTTPPILLHGHKGPITTLTFSPNGEWLATASTDTTRLWKVTDPYATSIVLEEYGNSITKVAFSPEGSWLAAGSTDSTRLWEIANLTATPIVLQGDEDSVFTISYSDDLDTVAFSPDGVWLATGNFDTAVRLWQVVDLSAAPILLQGHQDSIVSLAFSPNGMWLATGSNDRKVGLRILSLKELLTKLCATVGRNMTREEWRTYFGDEPYRPTCDQWATPPEE